VVKSVE
jgi:hypothetical protein